MYQSNTYNDRLNVTGQKIKELRMKNNLSLSGLSTKLALMGIDITKPSLHKLENGERILRNYEIFGLAHIFHVPMEELFIDFREELEKDNLLT